LYSYSDGKFPNKIKTSPSDTLNYLLRHGTDQQVNYVFHLDGYVNEEIMKQAVRLSIDAEPVLGCKLILNKKRTYWERRDNIDQLDYFRIIQSENPEEDVKKFVLTQIDPTKESVLKIRVFRAKSDVLVIKSDHSVMDGGGFYYYLTLLCSIYNNLIENQNYQIEQNHNTKRDMRQLLRHYGFITKVKSLVLDKGHSPTWSFPNIGKGKTKKNFVLKKIDRCQFESIKNYGKKHGASINDMFVTATFRALFSMKNPSKDKAMTIAIPTDLRVLMPDKKIDTIANLVSATFVNLKNDPEQSFDDMLIKINKQMKKKREIHLGLGQMFAINNIFRLRYSIVERLTKLYYNRLYKKGKSHPIVTNVGRIDTQKRNFGNINVKDAYIVTPINWAPSFSMGISSYNKQITLSIGFCEDSYEKESVESFLDLLMKELPK
jgi:NRPS condensation-like uncharacterized protein